MKHKKEAVRTYSLGPEGSLALQLDEQASSNVPICFIAGFRVRRMQPTSYSQEEGLPTLYRWSKKER